MLPGKLGGYAVKMTGCSDNEKGSFTVEAAIIFPIILLFGFAVVYFGLLMYQYSYIQASADRAAEYCAAIWANPTKNLEPEGINMATFKKSGLYSELLDSSKEEKLILLEKYVANKISKGFGNSGKSILECNSSVDIKMTDFITYKKLTVNIKSIYKIPLGKVFRIFNLNNHFTIKVSSEAIIGQPVEFIRNIDLISDIERDLESKSPIMKNLGKNAREIISSIQNRAADFLK